MARLAGLLRAARSYCGVGASEVYVVLAPVVVVVVVVDRGSDEGP